MKYRIVKITEYKKHYYIIEYKRNILSWWKTITHPYCNGFCLSHLITTFDNLEDAKEEINKLVDKSKRTIVSTYNT